MIISVIINTYFYQVYFYLSYQIPVDTYYQLTYGFVSFVCLFEWNVCIGRSVTPLGKAPLREKPKPARSMQSPASRVFFLSELSPRAGFISTRSMARKRPVEWMISIRFMPSRSVSPPRTVGVENNCPFVFYFT